MTFTQTDSIIPTLWNWSCKHCDAVNRMILTLASICQSVTGEKLSCQPSFCLPTVSLKPCFDPWHMKGKILHHPFSPKAHHLFLQNSPEVWVLAMSRFTVPGGALSFSRTLRGLCLAIVLPAGGSEAKMHHGCHTASRSVRGMHLLLGKQFCIPSLSLYPKKNSREKKEKKVS